MEVDMKINKVTRAKVEGLLSRLAPKLSDLCGPEIRRISRFVSNHPELVEANMNTLVQHPSLDLEDFLTLSDPEVAWILRRNAARH
jgi:hypothetical protein